MIGSVYQLIVHCFRITIFLTEKSFPKNTNISSFMIGFKLNIKFRIFTLFFTFNDFLPASFKKIANYGMRSFNFTSKTPLKRYCHLMCLAMTDIHTYPSYIVAALLYNGIMSWGQLCSGPIVCANSRYFMQILGKKKFTLLSLAVKLQRHIETICTTKWNGVCLYVYQTVISDETISNRWTDAGALLFREYHYC